MSAVSGTTRDAIDTEVVTPGGARFTLIDTAGIRKRVAVADSPDGAEPLSVNRALQAIRRAAGPTVSFSPLTCTLHTPWHLWSAAAACLSLPEKLWRCFQRACGDSRCFSLCLSACRLGWWGAVLAIHWHSCTPAGVMGGSVGVVS